jgi:hypothetical protein
MEAVNLSVDTEGAVIGPLLCFHQVAYKYGWENTESYGYTGQTRRCNIVLRLALQSALTPRWPRSHTASFSLGMYQAESITSAYA